VRKLYIGLCVALTICVGATAAFAATTTVKSSGKFQVRLLGQNAAGENVFTGEIVDKKYGDGAMVIHNKPPAGGVVKGKFKAFFDGGTIAGTASNKLTVNPDGTATISDGIMKIKRGTGAFKNVTGGGGTYNGTVTSDGFTTVNYKTAVKRTKR
jgi:hypothetical protein